MTKKTTKIKKTVKQMVTFQGELLELSFHRYQSNRRIAIELVCDDGSPYATATVNIADQALEQDHVFIKDYSENEGMLDALVAAKVVRDTGIRARAGFTQVPEAILLPPFLAMAKRVRL